MYLKSDTASSPLEWQLLDPAGNMVPYMYARMDADIGRVVLPSSGTYTIAVSSWSSHDLTTGSYSFTALAVPADQVFSIAVGDKVGPGEPVGAGEISTPGQRQNYTFLGAAGQIVYLKSDTASSPLEWQLLDPAGNMVPYMYARMDADIGRVVLPSSGTYTIAVSSWSSHDLTTGSYSFTALAVPADQVFSIAVGDKVGPGEPVGAGEISTPGQRQNYTFLGAAGQIVYLKSDTASSPLEWQLLDPAGNMVPYMYARMDADIGRVVLPSSGTYTIAVSSWSSHDLTTGSYSFTLSSKPAS